MARANVLPIAFKNAGLLLEDALPVVVRSAPTLRNFEHICTQYRRLAVGSLLMSADPTDFYSYLGRSSRAFLHFLAVAPEEEKLASRAQPFFDALACRDEAGIAGIAAAAPRIPNPRREYEEDFYHLRISMELGTRNFGSPEVRAMLAAFTELAADQGDPALGICTALVEGDAGDVVGAIRSGASARRDAWKQLQQTDRIDPNDAPTLARVSTEVLGWIELAARRGVEIREEIALAPSSARLFHCAQPVDPQAWRTTESFSQLAGG